MRKSFYAAASLAAGAALMLGGCGQTGKSIEEGAKPPAAKTSSTCPKGQVHVGANGPCADKSVAEALAKAKEKAAKPKPSPTKTHTPKPDPTEQVAKWGQTFTYKDGLKVTLSMEHFTVDTSMWNPSDFDIDDWEQIIPTRFTLVIDNGSKRVVDPTMATVNLSAGKQGKAVDEECLGDDACSMGVSKLLPGHKATLVDTFLVPTKLTKDVVVEVSPDFNHDSALYEGSVAVK